MGVTLASARRQIMELYDGNFYKVLIALTESPHSEVQYNCAGVIGHLAISGETHTNFVRTSVYFTQPLPLPLLLPLYIHIYFFTLT